MYSTRTAGCRRDVTVRAQRIETPPRGPSSSKNATRSEADRPQGSCGLHDRRSRGGVADRSADHVDPFSAAGLPPPAGPFRARPLQPIGSPGVGARGEWDARRRRKNGSSDYRRAPLGWANRSERTFSRPACRDRRGRGPSGPNHHEADGADSLDESRTRVDVIDLDQPDLELQVLLPHPHRAGLTTPSYLPPDR